jgi:hypothetical protein
MFLLRTQKMTTELTNPEEREQLPAFLEGEKKGVKDAGRYLLPSFFKLVQSQSNELKELYDEGTLLVTPENVEVVKYNKEMKRSDDVFFVPLLWYPEFTIHNPFGHSEFIRERTLDPESELAQKCRSRDPKHRSFECPEQVNERDNSCKYVEHLNFIVVLLTHNEEAGTKPIVITTCLGEWKSGAALLSLISSRPHSIYGGIYRFYISKHSGGGNSWYGWNFSNPPSGQSRFVSDEVLYRKYEDLNAKLEESLQANMVNVEYDTVNNEAIDPETSEY